MQGFLFGLGLDRMRTESLSSLHQATGLRVCVRFALNRSRLASQSQRAETLERQSIGPLTECARFCTARASCASLLLASPSASGRMEL